MISLQQQSGHAAHEIVRDCEGEGDGWGGKKKETEDERKYVGLTEERGRCGQGSFLPCLRPNGEQRGEFPRPPAQLIP